MESLNTELWKNPIWTSPVKFQTLGVWFIVIRAYMLVRFGMDTEQIVTNATNIFWMHSFISGHKQVEYIFRNHVSTAHVTVFITRQYPECQSYCSSLTYDWQLEHRQRRAAVASRGDSVVLPLIRRKVPRDVHKCATLLCIVLPTQYIITPHYHNTNHVLHRLYVITSHTKDCQMQCSWYM